MGHFKEWASADPGPRTAPRAKDWVFYRNRGRSLRKRKRREQATESVIGMKGMRESVDYTKSFVQEFLEKHPEYATKEAHLVQRRRLRVDSASARAG